jgi:hypothetical protein
MRFGSNITQSVLHDKSADAGGTCNLYLPAVCVRRVCVCVCGFELCVSRVYIAVHAPLMNGASLPVCACRHSGDRWNDAADGLVQQGKLGHRSEVGTNTTQHNSLSGSSTAWAGTLAACTINCADGQYFNFLKCYSFRTPISAGPCTQCMQHKCLVTYPLSCTSCPCTHVHMQRTLQGGRRRVILCDNM